MNFCAIFCAKIQISFLFLARKFKSESCQFFIKSPIFEFHFHGNELKMYERKREVTELPFKQKITYFLSRAKPNQRKIVDLQLKLRGFQSPIFQGLFERSRRPKKSPSDQKRSHLCSGVCAKYWKMKRGELSIISRSSSFFYTPHKIFTIFSPKNA